MRKERNWRPKLTGKNALLFTAAMIIAPQLIHLDTTLRVWGAAFGIPVDCSGGKSGELTNTPYDAVVILDGGPNYMENGQAIPNAITKRRIRAAAARYVDWTRQGNRPHTVILLKSSAPSNGTYIGWFRRYVSEASGNTLDVPDSAFIMENDLNTSGNAADLARIYTTGRFKRAAVFTTGTHLPRAMILTCGWGVPASGFDAESEILARDPSESITINQYLKSPSVRRTTNLEFWKRATLPFDRHGNTLTWLKQRQQRRNQ